VIEHDHVIRKLARGGLMTNIGGASENKRCESGRLDQAASEAARAATRR
jgi:hypothetical protein